MGQLYDLRKINIKNEEDVLDFIELIVTKAPQIVNVLKDAKLKRISLANRLEHANRTQPDAPQVVDKNASVLDQLTGKKGAAFPTKTEAQKRLEQMKAAGSTPAAEPAPAAPANDLPPAPVQPGEIGQLNVPTIDPKVPDTTASPDLPDASGQSLENAAPGVSEEEVAAAAGSKSERTPDNDLQPTDTPNPNPPAAEDSEELSDEEKAALLSSEAPAPAPAPAADTESVGAKVARKTKKKK